MAFRRALYPAHAQVEQGGGAEEHAAQQKARPVPHGCWVGLVLRFIQQYSGVPEVAGIREYSCFSNFGKGQFKAWLHTDSPDDGDESGKDNRGDAEDGLTEARQEECGRDIQVWAGEAPRSSAAPQPWYWGAGSGPAALHSQPCLLSIALT